MTTKKWVILCVASTIIVSMLCGIGVILWSQSKQNDITEKIENSEKIYVVVPSEEEPSDLQEAMEVSGFYDSIVASLNENDIDAFNSLLKDGKMRWITINKEQSICDSSYVYPNELSSDVLLKNGKLLEISTEVSPPEVELGISASLFGSGLPAFRESVSKEGFLGHVDWVNADIDYVITHFDAIYNQLVWTIEMPGTPSDEAMDKSWAIYKLSNDTYLISNGVSWFSDELQDRTLTGKTFVVKRENNELKIVAFIDVI